MDIKYLGHSSFHIKGKKATVVTDPYGSDAVGLKYPRHTEASIVTISHEHDDHNAAESVEGQPFIIRGPGEYEIQGVDIIGIDTFHDSVKGTERGTNSVYKIQMDGLTLVHLGDIGHALSQAQIELLGDVNILFAPVGGYYTAELNVIKNIITEIEPNIIIPMHYLKPGLNEKMLGNLMPLSVFLKEMGADGIVPLPKLSVTKDKLPEEMQIVILE